MLKQTPHANPFALLSEKEGDGCEEIDAGMEVPQKIPEKAPIDRMERRKWEAAKRQASFAWQKIQQTSKESDSKA